MASSDCNTFATATLYATIRSVVSVTNVYTTPSFTGGKTVEIPVTVISSYTAAQVSPTQTLYGTSCGGAAQPSTAPVAAAPITSAVEDISIASIAATQALAQATSESVQTDESVETAAGGNVETKTIVKTVSVSPTIITSTQSPTAKTSQQPSLAGADNSATKSDAGGAIAGVVIAIIVGIAILLALFFCIRKRRQRARDTRNLDDFFNDPASVGWRPDETIEVEPALSRRGSAFLARSIGRRGSQGNVLDLEREARRSTDQGRWAELVEENTDQVDIYNDDQHDAVEIPNGRPQSPRLAQSSSSRVDPTSPRLLTGANLARDGSFTGSRSRTDGNVRSVSFELGRMSPTLEPLCEFVPLDVDLENGIATNRASKQIPFHSLPVRNADKTRSMSFNASGLPQRPSSSLGFGPSEMTGPSQSKSSRPTSPHAMSYGFPSPQHNSNAHARPVRAGTIAFGSQYSQTQRPFQASSRTARVSGQPRYSMPIGHEVGQYPPSRYTHLDIGRQSQAGEEEILSTPIPAHTRSLSTGSIDRPDAPSHGGNAGMTSSQTVVAPNVPQHSYYIERRRPERSRSVLSIRNADARDLQAESDAEDAKAPRQGLMAPATTRNESNSSRESASAVSAASPAPSTPRTPGTPLHDEDSGPDQVTEHAKQQTGAGSAAHLSTSAPNTLGASGMLPSITIPSWTPAKWLARGTSTSTREGDAA